MDAAGLQFGFKKSEKFALTLQAFRDVAVLVPSTELLGQALGTSASTPDEPIARFASELEQS